VIWVVFIVVALAVLGLFAVLLTGRIGYDPLSEAVASQPDPGLGDSPEADDITTVRFDTALRGYRMDQVDDVLDRLQERLRERERELADRERQLADRDRAVADGDRAVADRELPLADRDRALGALRDELAAEVRGAADGPEAPEHQR
jgi:DivIVA domain-containing protein